MAKRLEEWDATSYKGHHCLKDPPLSGERFHLCYIPECETYPETTYNPKWLVEFVPYKEESPSRCTRYAPPNNTCAAAASKNKTVKCDTFVYQRRETTIVRDFNVTCEENLWKLTIIGTINVVGELVCLSYSGFISDKYGRKEVMIVSVLLSTAVGILRSFSPNYFTYASLEFLDTALGGGMYGAAFILAMEIVGSKERNVGNTIISCIYALGQAVLGITAWLTLSWRTMLRIIYAPGILSLVFFWTIPESIRWLLSMNMTKEAKDVMLEIARANKKQIPPETLEKLMRFRKMEQEESIRGESFLESVKSTRLLIRTVHCSFTWICCTFVYYGLTLHSVAISDNVYLSFIFATVVEIPGYVIYFYANEKIGRRLMMFFTLILAGISCVAVGFIPEDYYWFKLCAFLIGKCCSTIGYTVLYVYTTEMFPTNSRHTTFSICSMFGRLGSMVAPQVPLLDRVSRMLPLLMFGLIACSSGAMALLFPETLNIKLPDTIEEAVNIGKNKFASGREGNTESSLPLRTTDQSTKM
ncbi:organic cation transporter protein-like [Anoplophora glabripennis]|uniref:organic cation transporter protein-like n=1 Tax=Anoplophora glabripennis TaxID=217634 RepID=UPI00087522D6|nr:organic cation transporter protein-like [Anoplophora glabripennis]